MATSKFLPLFFAIFGIIISAGDLFAQINKANTEYRVQPNDSISKIARYLGSIGFSEAIYEANMDIIAAPDLIFPGQVLSLPPSVTESSQFVHSDSVNELLDGKKDEDSKYEEQLSQFRKLFKKVVNENDEGIEMEEKSGEPALELEGFILDETRTKMGRDFYDLFYQNWKTPEIHLVLL